MKRRKKKKRNIENLFVRGFLSVFILSTLCLVINQIYKYNELKAQYLVVSYQINDEKTKQNDLKNQLEYQDSDIYIESIAREQLGLVKPNEIIYIIND